MPWCCGLHSPAPRDESKARVLRASRFDSIIADCVSAVAAGIDSVATPRGRLRKRV